MLLTLLYKTLQLEPCTKWHFIKRIKLKYKIIKIKKEIKNYVFEYSNLFTNIIDFCTFMEHSRTDFKIDVSNYKCDRIYYDIYNQRYTYILRFSIDNSNGAIFNVKVIYRTPEPNRININVMSEKESLIKDVAYNLYIEKNNGSYKLDIYKKQFIDNMLDYMYSKLNSTIDDILNQYVYIRKEKVNEDKENIKEDKI